MLTLVSVVVPLRVDTPKELVCATVLSLVMLRVSRTPPEDTTVAETPAGAAMTDVAFEPLQLVQVPADWPHVHPPWMVMFVASATCSV
jgi:hypothetical protein